MMSLMEKSEDRGHIDLDVVEPQDNPLLIQLDEDQLELLDLIFFVAYTHEARAWPVWDYVSRDLCRNRDDYLDTSAVWRSLPTVVVPGAGDRYGLVWHTGTDHVPYSHDRVGLTIVGLAALSSMRPEAKALADDLALVIRRIADKELALESGPTATANTTIPIATVRPYFVAGSRKGLPRPLEPLNDEIAEELLQKEYARLSIALNSDGATAHLSPWLRRYRQMKDAAGYLEIIANDQQVQRAAPQLRADELALMLDHASFVLKSHSDWPATIKRMANPTDYQTAAALSLHASNSAEFQARMSSLWTLLGRLEIPEVKLKHPKENIGSLVRLQRWITEHVTDAQSRERAVEAIEDVRTVGALRNIAQHPSEETRKNEANACSKLGIGYPIRDWGSAWDVIRARVADSFYAVSQEVRS